MKIGMYNLTTTSRLGGIETFVWGISRELARRGEEVHIIGGRGKISENIPGVKIFLFSFLPRHRIPNLGTRFRKLVERWSFGFLALSTILRERYDILHIHKPFDLPFGLLTKKLKGSKLIFGSHGTDFFFGDRPFARRMDAAVSCSRFNGAAVEARYGIQPAVIYNGIDPEVFHPLPSDHEIQKKFGVSSGEKKTLVFAGRLIGWKGVGELLKAVALLKKEFSLRVMIIGDGASRLSLEKLSAELAIHERVTFTGFVPNQDLPRYYSVADLAVFPSLADETFGISICEAMACGRPVISTCVGGIPEVIEDGVSGFLSQPRNPQDLAEKISRLVRDDALRQEMGEAGRQRVLDHFTWEKVADRLVKVYAEVMARKSGGRL